MKYQKRTRSKRALVAKRNQNVISLLNVQRSALLFALTFIAFWQSIWFGFIWDDDLHVTRNLITQPGGLAASWFSSHQPNYWPITWSAFWLEWSLFGMNPTGYHIINILVHAANCLLLWFLLKRLEVPGAFAVALLFAVHPVNVECVSWITQLKTLLSTWLYFLSLLCFLTWQNSALRRDYLSALILFAAGLLTKPSVVMLPVVLIIILVWQRRRIDWLALRMLIPFFLIAGIMSVIEIWFQTFRSGAGTVVRTDGFFARLASAGWVVWFYFGKALWPFDLNFVYPRWRIDAAYALSYLPGVLLVFVFGTLGWVWTLWGRGIACAAAYFVVSLFPVMGFFNIFYMRYSYVADHWQYVALPGALIIAVTTGHYLLRQFNNSVQNNSRKLEVGAIALVVMLFFVLTFQHQKMYARIDTLYLQTISKNPGAGLAHSNLAGMYYRSGKLDDAVRHYRAALAVDATDPEAHAGLGNALFDMGNLEEAAGEYERAIPLMPAGDRFKVHFELGNTLAKLGRNAEALKQFEEVVRVRPRFEPAIKRAAELRQMLNTAPEAQKTIITF